MSSSNFFTILVCGGRYYNNKENVYNILNNAKDVVDTNNEIFKNNQKLKIVNGGANGADEISTRWAKENNIYLDIFEADWKTFGKAAGPIRNRLMFETTNPNIIIAFNGGNGTKNMIQLAKNHGYHIENLTEDKECQILYQA